MIFDERAFIEAGLYESDAADPWCRRCRTCRRAPDAHDLRCEAAIRFGLPRRAYPDYDWPIGPITRDEHRRLCEAEAARIAQAVMMRRVYGDTLEVLEFTP